MKVEICIGTITNNLAKDFGKRASVYNVLHALLLPLHYIILILFCICYVSYVYGAINHIRKNCNACIMITTTKAGNMQTNDW